MSASPSSASRNSTMTTIAKFKDGLSFIEAINNVLQKKSPIKSSNADQKWLIWYWKPNNGNDWHWEDFLQLKASFTTKDDFWRAYNEVNGFEFGLLSSHYNYCVFKEGIKPMWEDSANGRGGRWVLEFPRKWDWKHVTVLNDIWLKLVVLMIRHNINKIAIWTANADNTLVNLMIGEIIKANTGFNGKMYYTSHNSSDQKIVVNREKKIRFKGSPIN
ncbi:unnamed protein product [Medioppia subpectinata]|uniref:EIF-4F 25 kDa subunit n=1 Tax=Medioppia subpectinata TaxID=1979941 RepID=A0A7R9LCT2_9ACAR|nr:unnamed protein product [Medioppia subpectinata]CAG2117790.1 unnamed protein product [Medioppia subpectinata]